MIIILLKISFSTNIVEVKFNSQFTYISSDVRGLLNIFCILRNIRIHSSFKRLRMNLRAGNSFLGINGYYAKIYMIGGI